MKKLPILLALLFVGINLSAASQVITGFWSVHTLNFNPDGYIVKSGGDLQFLIGGNYDFNSGKGIHIESKGQLYINANPVLTCSSGSWTGVTFDGFWPSANALAATIQGGPSFENCDVAIKLTDLPTGTTATSRCRDVKIVGAKFINCRNGSIYMVNNTINENLTEIKSCYFQSSSTTLQDHVYGYSLYNPKISHSTFNCSDFQTGIHLEAADLSCQNNVFNGHEIGVFHDHYSGPSNGTTTISNNEFNNAPGQTAIQTISIENALIEANEINGGDYGVFMEFPNATRVFHNEMNNVAIFGVYSVDGYENDLSFNTIDGSAVGILVNTSDKTKILLNLISNHFIGIRTWNSTRNFLAKNEVIGSYGTALAGIEIIDSGVDETRLETNRVGFADVLLRFDGDNTGVTTCSNSLFGDANVGIQITGLGILDQGGPTGGGFITATQNDLSSITLVAAPALTIRNLSPYIGLQFYSMIGSALIPAPTLNAVEVATGNTICAVTFKKSPVVNSISENFSDFSFYPNPSNGELTIDAGGEHIQEVSIFDFKGSLIFSQNENATKNMIQIDIETLVKGGYILMVQTDKNIYRKKLVKS